MEIIEKRVGELTPYEKNTKKHDAKQIQNVATSIREFGFVQPLVIDENGVVVIGHCRLAAAKKLKMKTVPCVLVEDLTPEQVRKLRIADNKTNESAWDLDTLAEELKDLDFSDFDFNFDVLDPSLPGDDAEMQDEKSEYEQKKKEFQARMEAGELSEDSEEYQEFLAKFEPKKTTDDCYTPDLVYDAVADYVSTHYGIDKARFVRPFYPGGNYQAEKYKSTDVVVDNPPFSILGEIRAFYSSENIKYFLFVPALTPFSAQTEDACLCCGVGVTYENGACVSTSFATNLEECRLRSAPELYKAVKAADEQNLKEQKKEYPKYNYPLNVATGAMINVHSRYGISFSVEKSECAFIRCLDAQKKAGKAIYGSGFLISDKKKAEREKAEREKAEREKAEREKAEREKAERWTLSKREKEIIRGLST